MLISSQRTGQFCLFKDAKVNVNSLDLRFLPFVLHFSQFFTSEPAERLLSTYQSDLLTLLQLQEKMIKAQCEVKLMTLYDQPDLLPYLRDEERGLHLIDMNIRDHYEKYLEVYYDQRYRRQHRDIQQYFTNLREELPRLVSQTGSFP